MANNLIRPNFFPGQLIDFRDFNRLAEQPERVMSFLSSHLFQGGGIVVGGLEEFRLVPGEGLGITVKPGVAFLPSGHPLVLEQDMAVDLSRYSGGPDDRLLYIGLRNVARGTERFTDPEDPSVHGFRSQSCEPELVVTREATKQDMVELFRVFLRKSDSKVRIASNQEEWDGADPEAAEAFAVIDQRFRQYIVPQTFRPAEGEEVLRLRQTLYGIDRAHRKISKIFLVDDSFHAMHYLTQLHGEFLSLPFQPVKVAFLISEFSEKMALFLELVKTRVGAQRSNFDETLYLEIMELLDRTKLKRAFPRHLCLKDLFCLGEMLDRFIAYAEERFNLLNTVEEALLELRDRGFDLSTKITLAGHLFERVDYINLDQPEKWHVHAAETHIRNVSTKYRNGDALSLKGVFLKNGSASLELNVPHPELPIVVIARQYVRRASSVLRYEMNGRHMVTDKWEGLDLSNNWMNRGFVIPPESLVAQANRMEMLIEKSDLDFGFFDVSVYQPVAYKGALA